MPKQTQESKESKDAKETKERRVWQPGEYKHGPEHGLYVHIDLDELAALMRMKPTLEDTAAFFKVSTKKIERVIRENYNLTFVEFRHENMVHTRLDLIREAIRQAKSGNTAMLIFCLKNVCGWSDKLDVSNEAVQQFSLKYALSPKVQQEVIDVQPQEKTSVNNLSEQEKSR